MPKKWIYFTLVLFVLFLIVSNPTSAGQAARGFSSWSLDIASGGLQFLQTAFSGTEGAEGGDSFGAGGDDTFGGSEFSDGSNGPENEPLSPPQQPGN